MSPTTAGPLEDRVALVTGASRGIGAAIAAMLARDGARVAVHYHRNADLAVGVVASIESVGGSAVAVQADVARADDVDAMVSVVRERLGPIDILVNNAADTDTHRAWTTIEPAEWERVIGVTLTSAFLCFRAAFEDLRHSPHGRVINIGSATFHGGQAGLLHYVSGKGGMVGLTRGLAREIGPDGITVNCVAPGAIRTESEILMFPDQAEVERQMSAVQSLHRRGLPEDVAGTVAFLASDRASFITGQTILVDGGRYMS